MQCTDTTPWFVQHNRAFAVDSDGGCWVGLTRGVWFEVIGEYLDEGDVAFYGPVQSFA